MVLGFVLALGAALGLIIFMENADNTIRGSRQVISLLNVAPLAGIPYIATVVDHQNTRRKLLVVIASCFVLVIGALLAVHFLFMPLDVLWYAVLRKFGLDI